MPRSYQVNVKTKEIMSKESRKKAKNSKKEYLQMLQRVDICLKLQKESSLVELSVSKM